MTKRMLTAVLTAALTLSLTACGGGEQQEMGETCTVYTMDTVMNLTAYGENASAALDAAEETLRTLDAKLDRHDKASAVSALNRDGTVEDAELAQLADIVCIRLQSLVNFYSGSAMVAEPTKGHATRPLKRNQRRE